MRKVIKLLGAVVLACVASAALIACAEGGGTVWLSPMMSVSLEADKVDVYEGFDLAALNAAGTAPAGLLENAAVTKATVGIAYKGDAEYKALSMDDEGTLIIYQEDIMDDATDDTGGGTTEPTDPDDGTGTL